MPRVDFAHVDDVGDYTPLPKGQYRCRLAAVEEASTQYGDEMWKLRFEVAEGEHAGRYIFDNLVFSSRGLKHVKLVCSRMGIDVSGELDLTPDMLEGREVLVTVGVVDYEDAAGNTKQRNKVPFDGYLPAPQSEASRQEGERPGGSDANGEGQDEQAVAEDEQADGEDEEGIPF